MPFAALVDWDALGEAVVYGFAAGVGLTVVYSLTMLGFTRGGHAYRRGRIVAAGLWWLLGGVALAACLGGIALGLYVIADKD